MTQKHTRRGKTQCCCPKGFTLIELLVVVLIIGILAAVALPQYNKAVIKARFAEIETNLQTLAHAADRYYLEHDTWATDISQLDVEIPECHCIPELCTTCQYSVSNFWIDYRGGTNSISVSARSEGTNCGVPIIKGRIFMRFPEKIRNILGFTAGDGCSGYYRP